MVSREKATGFLRNLDFASHTISKPRFHPRVGSFVRTTARTSPRRNLARFTETAATQARICTCIGARLTETTRAGPGETEPSLSSIAAGPLELTTHVAAPGMFVKSTARLDDDA